MKLYVDTNGKQVTVTKDPVAKNDGQTDRQKTERGTGRPMWSTQVFVLDDDGGEVITVTTAGEKPNVKVGQSWPCPSWRPCPGRPTGATAWRSARRRSRRPEAFRRSRPADRHPCHGCHLECSFTSDA